MRQTILSTLLVVGLIRCYSIAPPSKPWVAGARDYASPRFCGIKHSLDTTKQARLLIIHGMGWHDYGYDEGFRQLLTARLQLKIVGCTGPYQIARPEDTVNTYGNVLFCTYRRDDGARLRTYTLLWSPLTRPYKVSALSYDWSAPYDAWRVTANGALKKGLVDLSLADAVLYSGELADEMQYAVKQALCAAMTDQTRLDQPCAGGLSQGAQKSDVFAATHSLGSIMLFESLSAAADDDASPAAAGFAKRVRLIGMMANQLPLIDMARRNRPPSDQPLRPRIPPFLSLFLERPRKVDVAAFTDVNDLLSYTIPENWSDVLFPTVSTSFRFINFPVTNAHEAWAFAVARPDTAHTGYWSHPWVIDAFANGYGCLP